MKTGHPFSAFGLIWDLSISRNHSSNFLLNPNIFFTLSAYYIYSSLVPKPSTFKLRTFLTSVKKSINEYTKYLKQFNQQEDQTSNLDSSACNPSNPKTNHTIIAVCHHD